MPERPIAEVIERPVVLDQLTLRRLPNGDYVRFSHERYGRHVTLQLGDPLPSGEIAFRFELRLDLDGLVGLHRDLMEAITTLAEQMRAQLESAEERARDGDRRNLTLIQQLTETRNGAQPADDGPGRTGADDAGRARPDGSGDCAADRRPSARFGHAHAAADERPRGAAAPNGTGHV